MLEELIATIAHDTELEPDKAEMAVQAMMRYITANFPSSIVGEFHEMLRPTGE